MINLDALTCFIPDVAGDGPGRPQVGDTVGWWRAAYEAVGVGGRHLEGWVRGVELVRLHRGDGECAGERDTLRVAINRVYDAEDRGGVRPAQKVIMVARGGGAEGGVVGRWSVFCDNTLVKQVVVGSVSPEPTPHCTAYKPLSQGVGTVKVLAAMAAKGPQGVVWYAGPWCLQRVVDG